MIIQDENRLKTWISNLVEDISDAEPDALAKYVIALVKKPLSDNELENLCSEKLCVFLQTHTEDFVAQLFSALKSGNYLTSTDEPKTEKEASPEPEVKTEEVIIAETDELVLTDPESEHEPEPESSPVHKESPKKETAKSKEATLTHHGKAPSRELKPTKVEARPSKEDSRRLTTEPVRKAPSPAAPTQKPVRRRISPPRSTSAERRIERRPSPIRRRVIIGGSGIGGGLRPQQNRHYRDVRRARSKSRSRSPHKRKEKRVAEMDGRSSLRRHRCRDFHEKGFCMRGDICPYDHGPDPVVVEDSALEKIVRSGAVFDPNSAYGVNPPPPGVENTPGSGKPMSSGGISTTEGYNPEAPALTTPSVAGIDFSVPPPPIPQIVQRGPLPAHQLIYPPGTAPPVTILPTYSTSAGLVQIRPAMPSDTTTLPIQSTTVYNANPTAQITTRFGGAGNGIAMRGGFRFKPYQLANRNPATRSLLVKKVPAELNKIAQLDQHFGKFGQVTNIQVQYEGRNDTALVTFKTRREAMMAYKSTEPIFNNRFIKVFWQNDTQAQNQDAVEGGTTDEAVGTGANREPIVPKSAIPSGPVLKGAKILPRYFKKTFSKKPATEKSEEGPKNAEEMPKEDKDENPAASETDETPKEPQPSIPITSNPSAETSTAYTPQQNQAAQSFDGGNVAAEMKRKSDKEALAKLMELHKMKAGLYGKLMDQQKMLLHKMKKTEDKDQKKKLMELLKKAEEPAKKVEAELEELGAKVREVQQRQQSARKRFKKVDTFY